MSIYAKTSMKTMPGSCNECRYGRRYGCVGDVECRILEEYFTGNVKPPYKERPDACPLVVDGEQMIELLPTKIGIIFNVIAERKRQDEKWGEQNHDNFVWSSIIGEEYGELCKAINERGFKPTPKTKQEIYTEAIHVMASCMAMLECIGRNEP